MRRSRRSPIADLMVGVVCTGILLALFRDADPAEVGVCFVVVSLLIHWAFRRLRSLTPRRGRILAMNEPSLMRVSNEEEVFLRHWIYDEAHYQDGPGPAKRLQLQHRAIPADLAVLIAAAIPDPIEQERAGLDRPSAEPPTWPWSEDSLRARVSEARAALARKSTNTVPSPGMAPLLTRGPG